MTTPNAVRLINIKGFGHAPGGGNVTNFNTIKSVNIDLQTNVITDASDDDRFDSFLAIGMTKVSGSMDMTDPIQRLALAALGNGTTTFQGDFSNGTHSNISITGCTWHSPKTQANHSGGNRPWGGGLSMTAATADGQTNPLTISAPA